MCETYNGWSNRETWAVSLHVSNTECAYLHSRALVKDAKAYREEEEKRIYYLERMLQDWVTGQFEEFFAAAKEGNKVWLRSNEWVGLMVNDVGSLWRVDWREFAKNVLTE